MKNILKSPFMMGAIVGLIISIINHHVRVSHYPDHPAGIIWGFWHGFTALFAVICSIWHQKMNMYEIHNSGVWYDLSFYIGIIAFISFAYLLGKVEKRLKNNLKE